MIHPPILYTGHNTGQIALWIVLALEAVTALGGTDRHFVQAVHLTGLRQSSEDRINPPQIHLGLKTIRVEIKLWQLARLRLCASALLSFKLSHFPK